MILPLQLIFKWFNWWIGWRLSGLCFCLLSLNYSTNPIPVFPNPTAGLSQSQRPFFPPQLWRMSDKQSIITSHFHLCDCAHQELVIRFAINHLQLYTADKRFQSINEILWVCGNIYSYTYFPLLFTGDFYGQLCILVISSCWYHLQ